METGLVPAVRVFWLFELFPKGRFCTVPLEKSSENPKKLTLIKVSFLLPDCP